MINSIEKICILVAVKVLVGKYEQGRMPQIQIQRADSPGTQKKGCIPPYEYLSLPPTQKVTDFRI